MIAAPTTPSVDEMLRFVSASGALAKTPWRDFASPRCLELLARDTARGLLNGPQCSALASSREGSLAGLACWTWLDWDTEQFGFPAARLDLLAASGSREHALDIRFDLLGETLDECEDRGVRHLIARVDAGDDTSIHALEHYGFELIDGIQTFTLDLSAFAPGSVDLRNCEVRPYRDSELEQVLAIARSSYVFDRFHCDPVLSPEVADRINETWVRNCCLGRMADIVMVAARGEQVLAFVTCKIDEPATRLLGLGCGVIGMVATDASVRRTGVASAATAGALEWFRSNNVAAVEVGTQLRNVPAARLYERCGFRLTDVSLTFRKWMGGP
jgi:dTDP-4-amino-4,6-dideoxy-D-galactose acyltransferase